MSSISNIKTSSGTYDIKDSISRDVTKNILYIKNLGAKGDGITSDSKAIQDAIDNNPYSTIIFEKGDYLLTAGINIYEDNASQVNLHFESGARLFTDRALSSLISIGKVKEGVTEHYDRYKKGNIVTISGNGIIDAENAKQAFFISANRKFTIIKDINIINCGQTGIYTAKPTLDIKNNSLDGRFLNITISSDGNYLENNIGFVLYAGDNEFNNIRIQKFRECFKVQANGNIFDNIHATAGFTENTVENFNNSICFNFASNGTGFDMLNNIYVDTYGIPFLLNATNKYTIFNNIFTYYYFNQNTSITSIFKFMVQARINVNNSRFTVTNSGTNKIVDLTNIKDINFRKNFIAFNYINFINCTTYHSVLELTDPYNSMQIRNVNSVILETIPYSTKMTQNSWYPVALFRNGSYNFKISMENSEIAEITLNIPSTGSPTITSKSIYSEGTHSTHWNIGIAEGFTDNDNFRYCYLVIQSKVTNLHYNPTIFDVNRNFLNMIYTYPEFNNNSALNSPSILVQTPLNS